MWTEKVAWFSNDEGRRGRIAAGYLADLVVPDRDFFACAEGDIPDITSDLTMVGGRIVFAKGNFARHDAPIPPAMPDWSPVRNFGGNAGWGQVQVAQQAAIRCGCASSCGVHGHDHAGAWGGSQPVSDLKSVWGALGCACWAV